MRICSSRRRALVSCGVVGIGAVLLVGCSGGSGDGATDGGARGDGALAELDAGARSDGGPAASTDAGLVLSDGGTLPPLPPGPAGPQDTGPDATPGIVERLDAHDAVLATYAADGSARDPLQRCADEIMAGQTCLAHAGRYGRTDVRAAGTDGAPITFRARSGVTTNGFYLRGAYVVIDNFTVEGAVMPGTGGYMIEAKGGHSEIAHCALLGPIATGFGAISIEGEGSRAHHNLVRAIDRGTAFLVQGSGAVVERNEIRDCSDMDSFRVFGHDQVIARNYVEHVFDGPVANHIDFIQTFGNNGESSYDVLVEENFVSNLEGQIGQLEQGCGLDPSGSNGLANQCTMMPSMNGTLTSVAADRVGDTTAMWVQGTRWVENYWAGKLLSIVDGPAAGHIYLVSASTIHELRLTNVDGSAADLVADGVRTGDAYELRMRLGWWTFRRNVFLNVALQLSCSLPHTSFVHNTIFGTDLTVTGGSVDRGRTHHQLVSGNVSIGATNRFILYNPTIALETFQADYNYVSGPPPTFQPAREECSMEYVPFRFCETASGKHGLNGGDPVMRDVGNPIGPDGRPFTDDDGLRPRTGSRLCGAGHELPDLGAYPCGG